MVNLGSSIGVSSSHLILRARGPFDNTTLPKIGEKVVNRESKLIGKISDIFGPVKKPFISVKVHSSLQLESFKDSKSQSFYTMEKNTKPKSTSKNKKKYKNTHKSNYKKN